MTASLWAIFEKLAQSSNIFVAVLAFFCALLAAYVLRTRHAQASEYYLLEGRFEGHTYRGKRKSEGKRMPFLVGHTSHGLHRN